MKEFNLVNVCSVDEAVKAMQSSSGKAVFLAGGTDLLGGLKREIYPVYPETVISLTQIEGLSAIREEDGYLKIGALAKLKDVANNGLVKEKYTALAEAAAHTASPTLRQMGTIGGNICQENRCWYYRAKDNYFPCKMKGGKMCYAPAGDNRNHSIFGHVNACFAVNPSDTAPALVAFGANIVTTQRTIAADDFFTAENESCTVLENGELVLEIQIPQTSSDTKSAFSKYALRPVIDFPMVNCAVVKNSQGIRICLNAVAPVPHRAAEAEQLIGQSEITEELAEKAGEATVEKARALSKNAHKIQIAKTMVKRTILECR